MTIELDGEYAIINRQRIKIKDIKNYLDISDNKENLIKLNFKNDGIKSLSTKNIRFNNKNEFNEAISLLNTVTSLATYTPGGENSHVQFNDGGSFGGDEGFTTNGTGTINVSNSIEIGGDITIDANGIESINKQLKIIPASTSDFSGGNIVFYCNRIQVDSNLNNPRGNYSVDLQYAPDDTTKCASGEYSFCTGLENTASGKGSAVFGYNNVASGDYSFACGFDASASGKGSFAHCGVATGEKSYATAGGTANGFSSFACNFGTANADYSFGFGEESVAEGYSSIVCGKAGKTLQKFQWTLGGGKFNEVGDAQASSTILIAQTTTAAITEMLIDGTDRFTLPPGSTWFFNVYVAGRRVDATNESYGSEHIGCITRDVANNTTVLIGSVDTVFIRNDMAWGVTIDADNTNDALRIRVTGQVSKTIRWTAYVRTTETFSS